MNFNLTLLGQAISLAIFVGICMRYIWPWVIDRLREREKRVADGLAAAEKGQQKLDQAQARYQEVVEEAKGSAADIVALAQKRGDEIIDEAKNNARSEGARIVEAAGQEVEQQKEAARNELRKQVAALALAGAEQILMREVDRKTHNELLEKLSARL